MIRFGSHKELDDRYHLELPSKPDIKKAEAERDRVQEAYTAQRQPGPESLASGLEHKKMVNWRCWQECPERRKKLCGRDQQWSISAEPAVHQGCLFKDQGGDGEHRQGANQEQAGQGEEGGPFQHPREEGKAGRMI